MVELDDLQPLLLGQRASVDEHASQLVAAPLAAPQHLVRRVVVVLVVVLLLRLLHRLVHAGHRGGRLQPLLLGGRRVVQVAAVRELVRLVLHLVGRVVLVLLLVMVLLVLLLMVLLVLMEVRLLVREPVLARRLVQAGLQLRLHGGRGLHRGRLNLVEVLLLLLLLLEAVVEAVAEVLVM